MHLERQAVVLLELHKGHQVQRLPGPAPPGSLLRVVLLAAEDGKPLQEGGPQLLGGLSRKANRVSHT